MESWQPPDEETDALVAVPARSSYSYGEPQSSGELLIEVGTQ